MVWNRFEPSAPRAVFPGARTSDERVSACEHSRPRRSGTLPAGQGVSTKIDSQKAFWGYLPGSFLRFHGRSLHRSVDLAANRYWGTAAITAAVLSGAPGIECGSNRDGHFATAPRNGFAATAGRVRFQRFSRTSDTVNADSDVCRNTVAGPHPFHRGASTVPRNYRPRGSRPYATGRKCSAILQNGEKN